MQLKLLFSILTSISFILSAQANRLDSLINAIDLNSSDTNTVLLLDKIAWSLKFENPDSALYYASIEYQLSVEKSFKKGKALALHKLGIILWLKGDLLAAIDSTEKALAIFKQLGDKKTFANTLNNLASIYVPLGNYTKALELRLDVLKMREELKDSSGLISSYINIGNIFLQTKDYHKALEYYNTSYSLIPKVKPIRIAALGDVYNNKAVVFAKLGLMDSSEIYYHKYIEICKQNLWNSRLAKGYMNLGTHYIKINDFQKALDYLFFAQSVQEKLKLNANLSRTYTNIGEVYRKQNNYLTALFYGKKAFLLATKNEYLEIQKNASHLIYEVYKETGNTILALEYLEKYITYNTALMDEEKDKAISEMEAKYQFEKKEKEIELLKKDALLKDKQTQMQKQQKYFAIAGAFIFLLLLLMAGNRLKLRRKLFEQKEAKLQAEAKYLEEEALRKEEELKATAEMNQLKAEKVQDELEHRNREITSSALFVAQKNEILSTIDEKLTELKDAMKTESKKEITQLKRLIKDNIELDEDWNNFKLHFEQVHPRFFELLSMKYPDLTPNEQKICAYLRMNLSGKEIARLMNITPKSTQMSRYRLKKKFDLGADADLMEFIKSI